MNARPLYRLCFSCLTITEVISYNPVPRWGQATAVVDNTLFVHGGKTDQYNSYGYTSAPNNNDILYLSLSSSFNTSSPPWQLIGNTSSNAGAMGPALSWHTLSAFDRTHFFLFGGEPDPNSPIILIEEADSVYFVDLLEPFWTSEPIAWADEPTRRIHHSATTTKTGDVYIVGGEKADHSDIAFSENYIFDPRKPSFTLLPSDNAPQNITGHASVALPDGRVLVFGGYSQMLGELLPLSTVWTLDSSQPLPFWSLTSVSNLSLPSPRRAFAATTISKGKVLIHGGSDAVLQSNFEDGWILDPSQDPMVWTQIEALSQLGALRDHLAVSSGDQVIFSFGYENDKPSPAPMRIFNTNTGVFETVFTPTDTSSPTQTVLNPSQISKTGSTGSSASHSSSVAFSTQTIGPNFGNPSSESAGSGQDTRHKIIALVVGSVLGVLGLMVVTVVIIHYLRRQRHHMNGDHHFQALGGTDDCLDDESEHLADSIPAAGSYHRRTMKNNHVWDFGILDTIGLATIFTFGTRTARNVLERKDMLADEDSKDFTPWRHRYQEGTVDRTWSLRSLMPSVKRSCESSLAGSSNNVSAYDPFANSAAMREEKREANYAETRQLHERRQWSNTSHENHHDPFADLIRVDNHDDNYDGRDRIMNQPYLHPIPQQLSTFRTILPVFQDKHSLSPRIESLSLTNIKQSSNTVTVSSNAKLSGDQCDTISSTTTSHASSDPPNKPRLSLSPTVGTSALVKRSDSWWSRFAKTSFLDRRSSSISKKTFDFRDPNPHPRLEAIEESMRTGSIDQKQSGSSRTGPSNGMIRQVSMLHNKSQSSVRTTDTEAIEKMARIMDVAHLTRSDSRCTASTSATKLSVDTHQNTWLHEGCGIEMDPKQTLTSPIEIIDTEKFSSQRSAKLIGSSVYPLISPPKYAPPGSVVARIQELERRGSSDLEYISQKQIKSRSKQLSTTQPVNYGIYGLVPRADLFVVNPDYRSSSSDDT